MGGGVKDYGGGTHLQHGELESLPQLVQGGGCQATAAAPDEAQGWGVVTRVVLASTCKQHLYTTPCHACMRPEHQEFTAEGAGFPSVVQECCVEKH